MPADRPAAIRAPSGSLAPDLIAIVALVAAMVPLVFVGVVGDGPRLALAAGSACGALALVLLARRSMELFVLVVLVARASLDGLHAGGRTDAMDPAMLVAAVFVVVSSVWWVGRVLAGRRHPTSLLGGALAAFVAATTVATLGSHAPAHSLGQVGRLAAAVLMFFVVDRLCEDTGRPDRVVIAIVAAATVPVTVALAGPLVGFERVEVKDRLERVIATFTQSNPFGHFLVIVLLILAAVVLTRSGRWRVVACVAAIPVGVTLGLTYTRLAWAAAVAGILVMAWLSRHRWLVPLVAVGLAVGAVASPGVGDRLDRLTEANAEVAGSESGLGWRVGQWGDVLGLIDGNVITGIGPDVAALELPNRLPPHNDYLRTFVETGILGLLTFLGVVAAMIGLAVRAWRSAVGGTARTIALAASGVVTAFVLSAVAANLIGQIVVLWYLFALLGAAGWVARHGAVGRQAGSRDGRAQEPAPRRTAVA